LLLLLLNVLYVCDCSVSGIPVSESMGIILKASTQLLRTVSKRVSFKTLIRMYVYMCVYVCMYVCMYIQ